MQRKIINEKSVVKKNPNLELSEVDGNVMIISVKDSRFYGLGSIGSLIWDMLGEACELNMIINKLMERYNVSYSRCLEDVSDLLNNMYDRDFIDIVS